MNWLDQLRTRFQGLDAIITDPNHRELSCRVNLSGFPADRLIIHVDRLIKNDVFASQIIYQYEQPCDLIVFYTKSEIPSVTLIEAKSTPNENRGDEFKAVDQLNSSRSVLDRALSDCSIHLPQFHITGAVVTRSANSGAMLSPDLAAYVASATIDIKVVRSGSDVYREMFGR